MFCALAKATDARLIDAHHLYLSGYDQTCEWQAVISYFPC